MGLIPSETIEEIRSRLDIVELVSEFVPNLSRAGRNMKGRCPFHQERTPSFIVSPERQTFHCFGCGEGGDAFTFVMKIENLSFTEAAEKLAQRAGIEVAKDEAVSPEQKERLKLREALEFAADFYHELLLKSPGAETARRYLAGRLVSQASSQAFKLGWAPGAASGLLAAAQKRGFSRELLVKAGLASVKTGREYFFERVLFPIRDAKGAVVAFGGRTLGDGQPKYLNSPESPIFSKGRLLYGLSQGLGEVRKERRVLLMEGYMDVIAAHQHGLVTACAPLGTALTPDHASLIKRYASEAVIVFDADSAGINAAVRGAELLLAAGLGVRIATVPQGKDPDEHLHACGVESFRKCLREAQDLVDFKTELLIRKEGPLSAQAKSSIAKQVLAAIEQCPDEILKGEWVRRLAQRLGVAEEALRKEAMKLPGAAPRAARPAPAGAPAASELPADERQVLELLLKKPALSRLAQENDFSSQIGQKVFRELRALAPWGADWAARLLERLEAPEQSQISGLLVSELDSSEEIVADALGRFRSRRRLAELTQLSRAGKLAAMGLEPEYFKLLAESRRTKVI